MFCLESGQCRVSLGRKHYGRANTMINLFGTSSCSMMELLRNDQLSKVEAMDLVAEEIEFKDARNWTVVLQNCSRHDIILRELWFRSRKIMLALVDSLTCGLRQSCLLPFRDSARDLVTEGGDKKRFSLLLGSACSEVRHQATTRI